MKSIESDLQLGVTPEKFFCCFCILFILTMAFAGTKPFLTRFSAQLP